MAAKGYLLAISWPDEDNNITVDQSVASSAYAVTNLLNKQPGVPWRSADTSVQTLSGSFTKPRPVDSFALWKHNLAASATLQLRLLNGSGAELYSVTWDALSPTYGWGEQPWDVGQWGGFSDEGFTAPYTIKTIGQVYVPESWELIITDTSNADGYIQAGKLMLGDNWQPDDNFEWEAVVGWSDPTQLEEYEDGSIGAVDELDPYREGELRWSWLDSISARGFNEITRRIGRKSVVLVNPYPDDDSTLAREQRVLVRLGQWSQPRHLQTRYWSAGISFREAL